MQESWLEIFLAVAMSRNFSKAAETLNVSSSCVSRDLKMLEDEVGVLLVDRHKGHKVVNLTPAGESFLPLVLKWQEIRREMSDSFLEKSAHYLTIAACETANNNILPPIYDLLLQHMPPVHMKIISDPTDDLYEKVETREIDVAFVIHYEPSKLVNITPIYREEMIVVRFEEGVNHASEFPLLEPRDMNPDEELFVDWSPEFRFWHGSIWDSPKSPPIELLTAYIIPNMLKKKGRWSIVPKTLYRHFQSMDPRINCYSLGGNPPDLILYKVTHKNPKFGALKGLEILDKLLAENGLDEL